MEIAKADFGWLEALRREHYPAGRNRVPAHLTMFRALPPSAEGEVRRSLARAAASQAPIARTSGIMDLDSGVAIRIESPELEALREDLAEAFHGLLTSQDTGRWTPHVTIQNKAEPRTARKLLEAMRAGLPLVTTAEAVAGTQAVPGRDLLAEDEPGAFAAAVGGLLESRERRVALRDAGYGYLEAHHGPEAARIRMRQALGLGD